MRTAILSLTICLASSLLPAQSVDVPLANWTVPTYHASTVTGGLTTMADVTPGVGFVGIQPCRVADTRGNGAPITGGIFANSAQRTWDLTGLCGLPAGTDAISANFTVVAAGGIPPGSFLLAWPTGQAPPPTAIMTYGPGQIISNAAIVPLGPGEQLNVNVSGSTHIVMDVNGYFTDQYNPGVSFHAVSSNVAPAILAENTSTVANAVGIKGVITSTNPGDFATAVMAVNNGDGYGLWGTSATGFGVVGGGGAGGVWATTDGLNANGVYGQHTGSSAGSGVYGQTSSTGDSAGVLGINGLGRITGVVNIDYTGVRGEGRDGWGVFGLTTVDPVGLPTDGVRGAVVNGSGGDLALGILGSNFGATHYGVYSGGDYGGTGAKYFVEPHPTDASKVIRYVALEGNEAGTYFRGRGKFQNGVATIEVPEDFRLVTDPENLSVVVTPIGEMASFAIVKIGLDRIVVKSSRNVEFFYLVNGIRRTHKDLMPIVPGREYMPESSDARMPVYLAEGQKQMLISNGTYRPDGTVNMETARRLGWDKEWEKRGRPAPQPTSD